MTHSLIYQKAVPLSPGLYRLDIVLKDMNSNNVGVVNTKLAVPRFQDDQLTASSLILADDIHPVSSKDIVTRAVRAGGHESAAEVDSSFAATDPMGVFLQVYNLKVDDKTHKAGRFGGIPSDCRKKDTDAALEIRSSGGSDAAAWRGIDAREQADARLARAREATNWKSR